MTNKSSFDQEYLYSLNIALCNHSDDVFEYLGLNSIPFNNYRSLACPIHKGDNITGLTIYPDNEPFGCWQCNTHGCHKFFPRNMIGFIWGVLSANNGWTPQNRQKVPFIEALNICKGMVGHVKLEKLSVRNKLLSDVPNKPSNISTFTREDIRKLLKIPTPFFKGFKESTLNRFDVGEGNIEGMENRAIVPIYNEDYFFLGCQGRHMNGGLPKWKNSEGLPLENLLYGMNRSKTFIRDFKTIILVEGPKDAWRLNEAGIGPVAATLGNFKGGQKIILEMSSVIHIKCMFDNDSAGESHYESVKKKCGRLFHVSKINYDTSIKDPGDLTNEQVREILREYICF